MGYRRVRPVTEGGVLIAIAVIFALIGTYMPFIGVLAIMVWPVPIAILGVRHGYKWSILATVIAALLIAVLVHPLKAVVIAIGLGLTGIVFGYSIRAGYKPAKVMALGTIAALLSDLAVLFIGEIVSGISIYDSIDKMGILMTEFLDYYEKSGIQKEQLALLKKGIDASLQFARIAFPASLLGSAILSASVSYWMIRKALERLGRKMEKFPRFATWEIPKVFVWSFALGFGLLWLSSNKGMNITKDISVNLLLVSAAALYLQGMVLLCFLLQKYEIQKMFRVIIVVMVLINSYFASPMLIEGIVTPAQPALKMDLISWLVIFAGVFETTFEYRKRKGA